MIFGFGQVTDFNSNWSGQTIFNGLLINTCVCVCVFYTKRVKIQNGAEWSKSIGEGQTFYGFIHLGNIKNSVRE